MGKGLKNQRIEVQTGVQNTRRRRGTFNAEGGQVRKPTSTSGANNNFTTTVTSARAGRITGSGAVLPRSVTRINPVTGRPSVITGGQAVTPTASVKGRQIKGSGNRNTKPNPTKKRKKK